LRPLDFFIAVFDAMIGCWFVTVTSVVAGLRAWVAEIWFERQTLNSTVIERVSRLDVTARSRGGAYREDVNKVWI
jgi:hypothetical protein